MAIDTLHSNFSLVNYVSFSKCYKNSTSSLTSQVLTVVRARKLRLRLYLFPFLQILDFF